MCILSSTARQCKPTDTLCGVKTSRIACLVFFLRLLHIAPATPSYLWLTFKTSGVCSTTMLWIHTIYELLKAFLTLCTMTKLTLYPLLSGFARHRTDLALLLCIGKFSCRFTTIFDLLSFSYRITDIKVLLPHPQ